MEEDMGHVGICTQLITYVPECLLDWEAFLCGTKFIAW